MSNYSLCIIAAMFFAFIGLCGVVFVGAPADSVALPSVLLMCAGVICDSIEKGRK